MLSMDVPDAAADTVRNGQQDLFNMGGYASFYSALTHFTSKFENSFFR